MYLVFGECTLMIKAPKFLLVHCITIRSNSSKKFGKI